LVANRAVTSAIKFWKIGWQPAAMVTCPLLAADTCPVAISLSLAYWTIIGGRHTGPTVLCLLASSPPSPTKIRSTCCEFDVDLRINPPRPVEPLTQGLLRLTVRHPLNRELPIVAETDWRAEVIEALHSRESASHGPGLRTCAFMSRHDPVLAFTA